MPTQIGRPQRIGAARSLPLTPPRDLTCWCECASPGAGAASRGAQLTGPSASHLHLLLLGHGRGHAGARHAVARRAVHAVHAVARPVRAAVEALRDGRVDLPRRPDSRSAARWPLQHMSRLNDGLNESIIVSARVTCA
jgi:hypothetical protein